MRPVSLRVVLLSPLGIIPQVSTLIFFLKLLLSGKKLGEFRKLQTNQ
jgi:hypothetical protein